MAAILLSIWIAITPYSGCVEGANCKTDAHCGAGVCEDFTCVCEEGSHDEGLAGR